MKTTYRLFVFAFFVLLVIGVIFSFSMVGKVQSAQQSGAVKELLTPFLEIFVGKGNVTDHFIRKLAHFTEYFILGVSLFHFFLCFGKIKGSRLVCASFVSLLVALCDETIQLFSGRGSQVADVWLDFLGAETGLFLLSFLSLLFLRLKKKK